MLQARTKTLDFARANAPWLAAGFLLAFGSSFGQTFFLSLFGAAYRDEFGLSDGEWGSIYMVATLFSGAAIVFLGPLVDRFRARDIALATGLVFALLALLMAAAPGWLALTIAMMGLRFCGQGMFTHLSQTSMARWFAANRGRALAIAAFGNPLGEAALPFLAVSLAVVAGWRGVWVAAAALLLLAILPALWRLLREERTPASTQESDHRPGLDARHWTRAEMIRHWSMLVVVPALIAPGFILTAAFFQISALAEARSWSLALATATYPVYSLASVGSALLTGVLVDRLSARALLPVYLLPMALGVSLLSFEGDWTIFGLMGFMGLTAGAASSIHSALLAELYGTRHLGAIRSLAHAVMVGATALGPGVTGALLDLDVRLADQFLAMAAYSVVVSAMLLFMRPRLF